MDIALDMKREIVTVVCQDFLYRFDSKTRTWIDFRSLNNIGIHSLAYDSSLDRYVGWTSDGKLIFISGDGDALFSKKVVDKLAGFGRLYDRGNGPIPKLMVVPNGKDFALIYISGNDVRNIWYYNLASDSALLTYHSGKPNVDPNRAPPVPEF